MQTYEKMFSNEVRLMTLIRDILKLTWNDEVNSFVVNGSIMEWADHAVIDLPNEVELDEDSIDSILIFGDGTIEFHHKNEQDAVNWAEFSEEVNEKVIEQLKLVWHKTCNQ
jgi:CRISPR/Cas system-associated protein Cas7 (RAMP superfamily)